MKKNLRIGLVLWASLSFGSQASAASQEENWSAGLALGWEMKNDVDQFLNLMGRSIVNRNAAYRGDDAVVNILLSIGGKLQATIGLTQTAVETYVKNYSHADSARVKACMVSGAVAKEARQGFSLSLSELSQPEEFQNRFETLYLKTQRFRDLLDCSFS